MEACREEENAEEVENGEIEAEAISDVDQSTERNGEPQRQCSGLGRHTCWLLAT